MTKSEMREVVLGIGIMVLLAGIIVIMASVGGNWDFQSAASRLTGLVSGGFLSMLGVVLIGASLDILDDLSDIVQGLWDRFLSALGR